MVSRLICLGCACYGGTAHRNALAELRCHEGGFARGSSEVCAREQADGGMAGGGQSSPPMVQLFVIEDLKTTFVKMKMDLKVASVGFVRGLR